MREKYANSLKTCFLHHKRLLISCIIFAVVFCVLGLPFTHWWFYGADDFHALFLAYKTKTWGDLFYFFYNGNIAQGAGPSNFAQTFERTSFFGTYYRPIYLILHALEYWCFGLNAYYFFLVSVFFHALNTVLLFNIFLFFMGYLPACLTAFMFAFHPQIAYRFGALVNLHYYVNVFLFLCMFLIFKKYLDSRKIFFYILACLFFCLSLFTRETTIVLPAILIFGTYLYTNSYEYYSFEHFFRQLWCNIKITAGFWLIMISFLGLRVFLYPFKSSGVHKSFCASCKAITHVLISKFPEFQVFVYDALSLSWLPWGHKLFRGILVSLLFLILSYLFFKNTKKIYVLYFLLCSTIMLWPAFVGPYSPRYFYEAYPFVLGAFIVLFSGIQACPPKPRKGVGWNPCLKKLLLCLLGIATASLAFFCFDSFVRREKKMHIMSQAVYELVRDPRVPGRALCCLSWPLESFGDQISPIFWVLFNDPACPVYCDSAGAIMQVDSNIVTPTRWGNVISKFYDENYVTITPVQNGFRFVSLNPRKVFFTLDNGYILGKKIINKTEAVDKQTVVTNFTLIIDQQYLDKKPVFVRWDYELKKFFFQEREL